MSLGDMITRQMLKTKVVHRLPGRLRLNVPALRHLPTELKPFVPQFERLIAAAPVVDSVKTSLHSANLLVLHRADSEEQLVTYINELFVFMYENRNRLLHQKKKAEAVVDKLVDHLNKTLGSELTFQKEVPADVWT